MDVRVPKLAEGISSGTVVSVLVSEGDEVKKDQTLLELETEKAVAPIPAPQAGKVTKIHVAEGDAVAIGAIILSLSESGAPAENAQSQAASQAPAEKVHAAQSTQAPTQAPAPAAAPVTFAQPTASGSAMPPAASPSIRKLAKQLGIDLARVQGTENGGRITLEDVRVYIMSLQQMAFQQAAASGSTAQKSQPHIESIDFSKWGNVLHKPLTNLRKKISQRMTESWTTIPHVTQFDEADLTAILALRKKYVEAYEKNGARLTVTSFLFKAVVNVLKEHPIFNSSLDEMREEIIFKNYFHLGLAVDTEQGLIVPVIRDVDRKDLVQISKDISELAQKTRDRKVGIEDLQGGTFTISNQGGIGGAHFTPIINKPEVAILGVGQGSVKQVVREGKVSLRTMLPLGLSYDHRLIDGGKAARFISDLVKAIETFPESELKLSGAKSSAKVSESKKSNNSAKNKGKLAKSKK